MVSGSRQFRPSTTSRGDRMPEAMAGQSAAITSAHSVKITIAVAPVAAGIRRDDREAGPGAFGERYAARLGPARDNEAPDPPHPGTRPRWLDKARARHSVISIQFWTERPRTRDTKVPRVRRGCAVHLVRLEEVLDPFLGGKPTEVAECTRDER